MQVCPGEKEKAGAGPVSQTWTCWAHLAWCAETTPEGLQAAMGRAGQQSACTTGCWQHLAWWVPVNTRGKSFKHPTRCPTKS